MQAEYISSNGNTMGGGGTGGGRSNSRAGNGSHPTHALVVLHTSDDVCRLLRLLMENGFHDVSFMSKTPLSDDWQTGGNSGSSMSSGPHSSGKRGFGGSGSTTSSGGGAGSSICTQTDGSCSTGGSSGGHIMADNDEDMGSFEENSEVKEAITAGYATPEHRNSVTPETPHSLPPPAFSEMGSSGIGTMVVPDPRLPPPPTLQIQTAPVTSIMNHIIPSEPGTRVHVQPGPRMLKEYDEVENCALCSNPITVNRYANLLNHARRHAHQKQYQCLYCDFQHNESAKIRLHMANTHNDGSSLPKDKWDSEMQQVWSDLIAECFPNAIKKWENAANAPCSMSGGSSSSGSLSGTTSSRRHHHQHRWIHGSNDSPPPTSADIRSIVVAASGEDCGQIQLHHSDEPIPSPVPASTASAGIMSVLGLAAAGSGGNSDPEDHQPSARQHRQSTSTSYHRQQHSPNGAISSGIISSLTRRYHHHQQHSASPAGLGSYGRKSGGSSASGANSGGEPAGGKQTLSGILNCRLCSRPIVSHPRQSLMNHAKRHCYKKQYRCLQCSYTSSEVAHVRGHMAAKHDITDRQPHDDRNPSMEGAWNQMLARCFPAAIQIPTSRRRKRIITGVAEHYSSGGAYGSDAEGGGVTELFSQQQPSSHQLAGFEPEEDISYTYGIKEEPMSDD